MGVTGGGDNSCQKEEWEKKPRGLRELTRVRGLRTEGPRAEEPGETGRWKGVSLLSGEGPV